MATPPLNKKTQLIKPNPVNKKPPFVPSQKSHDLFSTSETRYKKIIKLPKILVKIMQKRNSTYNDHNRANSKKRRSKGPGKGRYGLSQKIGAIISGACGSRRKAQEMCNYNTDAEAALENTEERIKTLSFKEHELEQHGSRSCNKIHAKPKVDVGAGFYFRKWKAIKNGNANANGIESMGSKPNYWRMRSGVTHKRYLKGEKEDTNREVELCKKRILMGIKCRPLNLSGKLQYDKNGILLPEPSEEF
ncbi:hypothetical protein BUALT_Bualt19G0067600 [Buddleja alternifolia]|uniref:HNH homing endonuclease n=1 Tax=Buddleja alternifolia TaxID=168488 RepID=A0AAV6W7P2_9LAMI|nr:hypothetical protein BUALT_Bualt19G0067600 [Buddleja alternifolia]